MVAFPTETVYGLGADALSPAAVRRVYELKGRPRINPLIVHVTGPEMAARVCEFDERAARLTRALWPGPVSLVLPKRDNLPELVTAGGRGVAVRCPSHPVALALLYAFDSPLVGPSANPSGMVSPTRAEHVRAVWNSDDVLVLDGGACLGGIESTVVSLEGQARILRPGLVCSTEIEQALGERVLPAEVRHHEGSAPLPAPGLLDRHYAPRTPALLVHAEEIVATSRLAAGVKRIVLLARSGEPLVRTEADVEVITMPQDAEGYAAALYEAMHLGDRCGAELMLIEHPPTDGELWGAVLDRLRRATTAR